MSDTYTITSAGLIWTIGMTPEPVTVRLRGHNWPMEAVRATSTRGTFLIVRYEFRMWHPKRRPFNHDSWIVMDARCRPIAQAVHLADALWVAATGRDLSELDVTTTAVMVTDNQPQSRWAPAARRTASEPQAAPEASQQRPRSSVRQKLAKFGDLFRRYESEERQDEP